MKNLKILFEKKLKNDKVVAIVKAKDWYNHPINFHCLVLPEDFVVCSWFDYHHGFKRNIEGKETIAVCRKESDAKLVFKNNCK